MSLAEDTCRFCALDSTDAHSAWNRVILETDHFVAVPSKGSLVPGWTLIIPKLHCLSFSDVPTTWSNELVFVIRRVETALASQFTPATFFEHGPVALRSAFGCGIDHAHLHAVPLPFDLARASRKALPQPWLDTEAPWRRTAGHGYVTVRAPLAQCWSTCEPEALPRQFFRQVIARELGCSEYHYDKVPRPDIARETVRRLSSSLA